LISMGLFPWRASIRVKQRPKLGLTHF
jgi:hypothetical protein